MKKILLFSALAMLTCGCSHEQQNGPDLTMYGIKGQVKGYNLMFFPSDEDMNMVSDMGDLIYEVFLDQAGHIIKIGDEMLSDEAIERDADGRMIRLGTIRPDENGKQGSVQEFYYHGALCDSIISYDFGEQSIMTTDVSEYNEQGEEISCTTTTVFDGNIKTNHQVYTVLERDEHGNWTKRHMAAYGSLQLLDENGELLDPIESTNYFIQTRSFAYWN